MSSMTSLPCATFPTSAAGPLAGTTILVVEDHFIVAVEIVTALKDAGARVVGPFPTMVDALENLSDLQAIDCALLDIGLGSEQSYPLAEALKTTQVPFMFLTGRAREGLPAEFLRTPHMLKPVDPKQLIDAVVSLGVLH